MPPAAIRVFETVELLEMILLKTPAKDVLLNQRVNKMWMLTTTNSIKLQRHLFFRPEAGDNLRFVDDELADALFPTYRLHHDRPARIPTAGEEVRLNPMIGLLYEKIRLQTTNRRLRSQLPLAWRLSDASWKPMLFTQPPVLAAFTVLSARIDETRRGAWVIHEARLIDTEVMKLGHIFEWMNKAYMRIHHRYLGDFPHSKYVRVLGELKWNPEGRNVGLNPL